MSLLDDYSPGNSPQVRGRNSSADLRTVLGKAFTILEAFCGAEGAMSLTALSRSTGLTVSTVYRLGNQLVELGVLARTSRGLLWPGRHLFELGLRACATSELIEAAQRPMQDLYELTHHTVHLGVLDGADVVYVSRLLGRGTPALTRVGGRRPAHATALGKAILAFTPGASRALMRLSLSAETPATITSIATFREHLLEARRTGVAFERDEAIEGYSCVAAPVLDGRARSIAAVSVMAPSASVKLVGIAHVVREAARRAGRALQPDWEP